jgi:hypothetical protein
MPREGWRQAYSTAGEKFYVDGSPETNVGLGTKLLRNEKLLSICTDEAPQLLLKGYSPPQSLHNCRKAR